MDCAICEASWAEYREVCDAAWAEYREVRDAALAECEKVRQQHQDHEPRTTGDGDA